MGRPLKKSFFGSPSTGGKQLVLSHVWLEDSTAAETGFWIIRQVGTGRYQVTNGTKVGVVKLVDALPVAAGEGTIEINVFGSSVREYASKIFNRTVKTFDGNSYKWSAETATEVGQADLPFEFFLSEEEETDFVAEINAGDSAAILTLITENPAEFFTSDAQAKFEVIETVGEGRKTAVANGVAQWIEIFGEFTSIAQARDTIEFHTNTEYNKGQLILAADGATTANKLDAALKQWIPVVLTDRVNLIQTLKASEVQAAKDLGVSLETEAMTVSFKALNDVFVSGTGTKNISADIFAARNAYSNGKFFGVTRMIEAINNALAA